MVAVYPTIRKTISLILFIVIASVAGIAQAQDPLCDTALYDQMTERGRLQGQREFVAVENLIYKPDSVLEYTCFPRFVDHIRLNIRYASPAYVADTDNNDVPDYVITFDFPTDPINDLSYATAANWMWQNFGHTYLGGRAAPGGSFPGIPGNYTCAGMQFVATLAKCEQFAPQEPEDEFFTLTDFLTAGILRYPARCTSPPDPIFGDIPAEVIEVVNTNALADPLDCGQPIPTGQVVTMAIDQNDTPGRPVTYNEKVCPNAACTYVPTALDAGNCVP